MAYETRRLGLIATLAQVLRDPEKVFARMSKRGRPFRALEIAALAWALPAVGVTWAGARHWDLMQLVVYTEIAALGAGIGVLMAAVLAVILCAVSRVWTPRTLSMSLRAAGYGQVGMFGVGVALAVYWFTPRGFNALLSLAALIAFVHHQANAFGLFLRGREGPRVAPRVAGAAIAISWILIAVGITATLRGDQARRRERERETSAETTPSESQPAPPHET